MPFNTALSGIRAANEDLRITGNNIANASTTGFKESRAEFGDVYTTSVLGAGLNPIGSGVRIQDVSQQFGQGNVSFTEKALDLAVNGGGFFVVSQNGDQLYTRSGTFGLDRDGFIVNNIGARLQGFGADSSGAIGGILGDLQIETDNLPPRGTTLVESGLNLNSKEQVLQRAGVSFSTEGNAIGVTQAGLQSATTTALSGGTFTLPLANDFSTTPVTMDIELTGSSGNNGTVSVIVNSVAGAPASVSSFNDLRTLASVINTQIFSPTLPQTAIDVVAVAEDLGGGNYGLSFQTLQSGESSQIRITGTSGANVTQLGLADPGPVTSTTGVPEVSNGYPAQALNITNPDGDVLTYNSSLGASAAQTASELNAISGVTATALTTATISNAGYTNLNGNMVFTLNGIDFNGNTLTDLAAEINALTSSSLPGISAEVSAITGDLTVSSSVGEDLRFSIASIDDADTITVRGNQSAPAQILEVENGGGLTVASAIDSSNNAIVVGGGINVVLDENYSASDPVPAAIGLFSPFGPTTFEPVVINAFNPGERSTYNHSTSLPINDSLGNSHSLEQYFVKQPYDPTDPTTSPNHWVMYVQIDGQDVGDPDSTLPPPQNTQATLASFNLHFNPDGTANTLLTDSILISNWTPVDDDGQQIGALGPQNVLQGGAIPVPDPPTSSNFQIDMAETTQVGNPFEASSVDQNGFATGRLSGVSFSDDGVIFARFTNGEARVLGQLALADFPNLQGLQPVGDTSWSQSFESGVPIIGPPGTASLGLIQAGALEDSNVDLSEQLVNLIIAQRNFQASAKTIETADQTTQTIINLR